MRRPTISTFKRMIGQPSNFDGWIDQVQAGAVLGWATDRNNPLDPANLIFVFAKRIVGTGRAEQRREDVAQALQVSVRCGFRHLFPPAVLGAPTDIAVLVVDDAVAAAAAEALKRAEGRDISIDDVLAMCDSGQTHALPMGPNALTDLAPPPPAAVNARSRADAARGAGHWTAAAFFYGKAASHEPDDAALWTLHGDMLRRSGLFERARASHARASALRPDDAESLGTLASLALARGDLVEAGSHLGRRMALRHADAGFSGLELEALRHSGAPSSAIGAEDHTTFFLSCATPLLPDGDPQELKHFLGAAHYSYSYILRGYLYALEEAGYDCKVIGHPEYMPDIRDRMRGRVVHIGFYPPDEPRFLKGAFNVTCIAWEFERLRNRTEAKSYHAFSDAATMLARSDEVWAISEYGAAAVRRSGIERVRAISTPIPVRQKEGRTGRPSPNQLQKAARKLDRIRWRPLAILPAMQDAMSARAEQRLRSISEIFSYQNSAGTPTVFVSVFNVHDYRKQLKPLLESFVRFSQDKPNAYLLLKVTSIDSEMQDINRQLFAHQVADPGDLTPPLVSDRVLMTTDTLSRDEMNTLNDLASFYVCTSHAEGQNLPLIEAMAAGTVPVTVDHTAMRDYITADNAVVIPSSLKPMTRRLTARYDMYGVSTYFVDSPAVHAALCAAFSQSDETYETLSKAAVATVARKFGPEPLIMAIEQSSDRAAMPSGSH